MVQLNAIYRSSIPQWLRLPLLVAAMFPHLMLMSLFSSNSTFTASYLDIEAEDIQFLLSLMYGSVVVALLVFHRFFAYFRLRSYILLMTGISISLLLLITVARDYVSVVYIRTLSGIFGVMEGACFLPLIIKELKTSHARLIAYLFLYAIMLTGGTFTASILKYAIVNFGYKEMIYLVLLFHLLVLFITLLLFNNNRLSRKYPLFQIDYVSCLFLLVVLHSGAYTVIYGRKLYWFQSAHIIWSTSLFLIFSGLFIFKNLTVKRPHFKFEVLQYRNVLIGISLFIVFYIIRSGLGLVYNTMATVWKWPWEYVINVQYFNVAGTILGTIGSGVLMIRSVSYKTIFSSGFLLMALSSLWFITIFYPDGTLLGVGAPLFVQGFGQGWLFTPIVMYMTSNLPAGLVSNASMMGTSTRFWFTNIGFALMQNSSYVLNWKHFRDLSAHVTASHAVANDAYQALVAQNSLANSSDLALTLANGQLSKQVLAQATLLSNMEIFTALTALSVATLLFMLTLHPQRVLLKKLRSFLYSG